MVTKKTTSLFSTFSNKTDIHMIPKDNNSAKTKTKTKRSWTAIPLY